MGSLFTNEPVPARFQRGGAVLGELVLDGRQAEALTRTATLRQRFVFPDRCKSFVPVCVLPVRDEAGAIVAYDVPVE